MSKLQLEKIGKILGLAKPTTKVHMTIYMHDVSREDAKGIMKRIPKNFRKKSKITDCGNDWSEATKGNVYGLGHLEVTVFYPKRKEVNK